MVEQKTVTETTEGTKPTAEEQANAASKAEGQAPEGESKVSSEKAEEKPIYTQAQADSLLHASKSDSGRLLKDAETARDEALSGKAKAEADSEDIQEERNKLQTDLDDLNSEDPKKFDIIKRDKDLRDQQRELKKGVEDLATEVKVHAETVKIANDTNLEIAIWETATKFKNGDPVKLKALCESLGVTDASKLGGVAETIWEKADGKAPVKKDGEDGETKAKEKLKLDTGDTSGDGNLTEQEKLDKRYPSMAKK